MTNAERRELLHLTKQAQAQGFQGSVLDVFQNPIALQEFNMQQQQQMQQQMQAQPRNVEVAATPEQQQQGLRGRAPQDAPDAMVFPNVPANTPFNTVGMKFPINIEKRDEMGHLVESHQNVPPGLVNIGTGPKKGTVIETRAQRQYGGLKKRAKQSGGVDYRIPSITQTFNEEMPANTLIQVDPETGKELAYVDSSYNPSPQPMDFSTMLHRQAFAESSFRDDVVTGKKKSTVGAMGLAQFMPNTVEDMKRIGLVEKDFDPYDTTQAATAQKKYMDWLGQRPYLAKGDSLVQQAKVLGAYNAGPGTIKNVLTKAKNDGYDIYNSTDWINHPSMPSETRDYVEKILLKKNPRYEKGYKSVQSKYRGLYFKQTGGYKSLPKY